MCRAAWVECFCRLIKEAEEIRVQILHEHLEIHPWGVVAGFAVEAARKLYVLEALEIAAPALVQFLYGDVLLLGVLVDEVAARHLGEVAVVRLVPKPEAPDNRKRLEELDPLLDAAYYFSARYRVLNDECKEVVWIHVGDFRINFFEVFHAGIIDGYINKHAVGVAIVEVVGGCGRVPFVVYLRADGVRT